MVPLCIIFVKQICRHKKMPRLVKDGADMSCRPQSAAFCKKCKKRYRPAQPGRYTKKPENASAFRSKTYNPTRLRA